MAANVRLLITLLTHAGMDAPSCRLSYVWDVAPPVPGAGMRDNGPYVKWSSGIVTAQRIGCVVCLAVDGVASPGGSWGSGALATLPASMRPPYQIRAAVTIQNTIATAIIEVSSAGVVSLQGKGAYGLGDGNNWVFASAAWIVR